VTISIQGLGEIPEVSDEIINDLDKPATIDDIEYSGARARGTGFSSLLSWQELSETTFDRDRLKAALIDARALRINEDIIDGAADWICSAWFTLRMRKVPPSEELRDLHKALLKWNDNHSWREATELSLWPYGAGGITELAQAVDRFIKHHDRTTPRGNQQKPLTTFQARLHGLYIAVSGKEGLKDGGPAHRFVKECAAIAGVRVPESGFASLIRAAIKRERCKNRPTKRS
jgi:hypothetical protein